MFSWYLPDAQFAHTEYPVVAAYLPGVQYTQALVLIPAVSNAFPATQLVQMVAPMTC